MAPQLQMVEPVGFNNSNIGGPAWLSRFFENTYQRSFSLLPSVEGNRMVLSDEVPGELKRVLTFAAFDLHPR